MPALLWWQLEYALLMHPGVLLCVIGAANPALKTLRVGAATGSDTYNVPYTVTVVGAGSYISVQPWNWAADVNSSGQVRPCSRCCPGPPP